MEHLGSRSSPSSRQTAPVSGKLVRDTLFHRGTSSGNFWICRCGIKRTQTGTRYTKIVSHVRSSHPDVCRTLLAEPSESATANTNVTKKKAEASTFFCSYKAIHRMPWIELIVDEHQPFCIVESETFRKKSSFDPILRKTLVKCLKLLTSIVEGKISKILPDTFAIVLDGWSTGDSHYVAVYAKFPFDSDSGYRRVLLGFSTFEEKTSQSAEEHYSYLIFLLSTFQKSMSNVCALIGDNYRTNKALVERAGVCFVECASLRFNLAVKDKIARHQDVADRLHDLMKELQKPVAAAKLRKHTHLRAKINNKTRWSSTYNILHPYIQIRSVLRHVDVTDIENCLLSPRDDKNFVALYKRLSDLNSVTKTLQSDKVTLSEVRAMFDMVIQEHPDLRGRLSANAGIMKEKVFEAAICKLQDGEQISRSEKLTLKGLEIEGAEVFPSDGEEERPLAERALKRRKMQQKREKFYVDTRFVVPTSNMCERLFSVAGYSLSSRRKSILPKNFELQVFLHENRDMWGIADVHEVSKSA